MSTRDLVSIGIITIFAGICGFLIWGRVGAGISGGIALVCTFIVAEA